MEPQPPAVAQFSPDEIRLASYLDNRQSAAWGEVAGAFRTTIAATIIKLLRRFRPADAEDVDELIQEVYLRLCANDFRVFRTCRATHPKQLFALVQAVAATTTLDFYRGQRAQSRGGKVEFVPLTVEHHSPLNAPHDIERNVLITQIEHILGRIGEGNDPGVNERNRQIFWLYYRHGYSAKDIAAVPSIGLSRAGVESVVYRLLAQLQEVMGKQERAEGSS
jgi:RNA polymerase sigma-70 factor (ECF subfamily)